MCVHACLCVCVYVLYYRICRRLKYYVDCCRRNGCRVYARAQNCRRSLLNVRDLFICLSFSHEKEREREWEGRKETTGRVCADWRKAKMIFPNNDGAAFVIFSENWPVSCARDQIRYIQYDLKCLILFHQRRIELHVQNNGLFPSCHVGMGMKRKMQTEVNMKPRVSNWR